MTKGAARHVDCLIIGGGPGGLTAANYLARFRRSVVVVDANESRLKIIPLSRNIPGFPEGVSGPELLKRMRAQAEAFGAELVEGHVTVCEREGESFLVRSSVGQFRAKAVLLASGVDVTPPDMPDLDAAIARGVVRYCPVCDGFEAQSARIAVLGGRSGAIDEAHFLLTYSQDITYVPMPECSVLTDEETDLARSAGIVIEDRPCTGLMFRGEKIEVRYPHGDSNSFDILYPCLGSRPRSELAEQLGARLSDDGALITDSHSSTNIPGLYAVGDVLRGLDQVASACGHAAAAATAIHNRLRR